MSHSFKASKTYRFFCIPSENSSKNLLVTLHGYGQLAAFFIKKFNACSNDYTILAPEGPHRFYKNGYSGRVGASWMTKEAREDDIKDNINWLTEWLTDHLKGNKYDKIILLGFSQGGATAARWYYNNPNLFDQLILWASVFPPDISKPKIKLPNNNLYVVGKNDEFINDEMRLNEVKFYQNIGFDTHVYDGNHDIDPFVIQQILK
ncbi:MAG: alpha/beta fold hydrolase [Bacteroidota bacterium]|nr:alpha/beta fold hydrolase [Bacteroidota bacterium]